VAGMSSQDIENGRPAITSSGGKGKSVGEVVQVMSRDPRLPWRKRQCRQINMWHTLGNGDLETDHKSAGIFGEC
jgi:hypothetical protein